MPNICITIYFDGRNIIYSYKKFERNIGNDIEIKMVQHAQDSTNILNDFESVKNEVELINKFSEVAGPKLNIINLNAYLQVL